MVDWRGASVTDETLERTKVSKAALHPGKDTGGTENTARLVKRSHSTNDIIFFQQHEMPD